jgi:group I intron endonuclease
MIGIYKITNNINQKAYIGLSINIENRWKQHINYNSSSLIHLAIKKYGKENFTFEILEECEEEMLPTREEYWIEFYKTHITGYNIVPGGNRPPIHLGENNKAHQLSDIQVDEIYRLLQTTNTSYEDIAKKYGVWASSIGRIDKGLIRAKEGISYPLRTCFHERLDDKADEIISLLENTKLTHSEIGAKLGVAKSTVTMINIGKHHFDPNKEYPIRKISTKDIKFEEVDKRNRQIIDLLRNTKLTQSEIGRRFNITPQTVCDINKGRRHPFKDETYPIR